LTAILLLTCKDRIGLVSRISHFIYERGGNIIDLDEHVDPLEKIFFIRVSWDMTRFSIPWQEVEQAFLPLAREFNASWNINFTQTDMRVALMVSKHDHCLHEILWRKGMGEFPILIPLIISNHPDLKPVADHYSIPFHLFEITDDNKKAQEEKEIGLLHSEKIDCIILARYMQILSPAFVKEFPNRIINIHHSFLPAFAGGKPYRQAYDRGVKIIGATSHYVTDALDDGPIIDQDIIRISHKDSVEDLIRKGRDLERRVLSNAVFYHTRYRLLVHGKKTIIFD
jgi:formyltetrahydrofolate deformylase